jgi:hypothetical protein
MLIVAALMGVTYLIWLHVIYLATFFGESPDSGDYRSAAITAAVAGITLATPLYLIGGLRRQKGWKIAAVAVLGSGLLVASADLLNAASLKPG